MVRSATGRTLRPRVRIKIAKNVRKTLDLRGAFEELGKQSRELRDMRIKNNALYEQLQQAEQKYSNEQLQRWENDRQLAGMRDKVRSLTDTLSEEGKVLHKENQLLREKMEKATCGLDAALMEQKRAVIELATVKAQLSQARKEQEFLKIQYEARLTRYEKESADAERDSNETMSRLSLANAQLTNQLQQLMARQAKPVTSAGLGAAPSEKVASECPRTTNVKSMTVPNMQQATIGTQRRVGETPLASICPMVVGSRTTAILPTSQTANDSRLDWHDAPPLPPKPPLEMCANLHAQESPRVANLGERNVHSEPIKAANLPRTSKCIACDGNCSTLATCRIFTEITASARRAVLTLGDICISCLGSHRDRCSVTEACGVDGCDATHHLLLHHVLTAPGGSQAAGYEEQARERNSPATHHTVGRANGVREGSATPYGGYPPPTVCYVAPTEGWPQDRQERRDDREIGHKPEKGHGYYADPLAGFAGVPERRPVNMIEREPQADEWRRQLTQASKFEAWAERCVRDRIATKRESDETIARLIREKGQLTNQLVAQQRLIAELLLELEVVSRSLRPDNVEPMARTCNQQSATGTPRCASQSPQAEFRSTAREQNLPATHRTTGRAIGVREGMATPYGSDPSPTVLAQAGPGDHSVNSNGCTNTSMPSSTWPGKVNGPADSPSNCVEMFEAVPIKSSNCKSGNDTVIIGSDRPTVLGVLASLPKGNGPNESHTSHDSRSREDPDRREASPQPTQDCHRRDDYILCAYDSDNDDNQSRSLHEMYEDLHAQECLKKILTEYDGVSTIQCRISDHASRGFFYHWARPSSSEFRRVVWDRAKDGHLKERASRADADQAHYDPSNLAPSQPAFAASRGPGKSSSLGG